MCQLRSRSCEGLWQTWEDYEREQEEWAERDQITSETDWSVARSVHTRVRQIAVAQGICCEKRMEIFLLRTIHQRLAGSPFMRDMLILHRAGQPASDSDNECLLDWTQIHRYMRRDPLLFCMMVMGIRDKSKQAHDAKESDAPMPEYTQTPSKTSRQIQSAPRERSRRMPIPRLHRKTLQPRSPCESQSVIITDLVRKSVAVKHARQRERKEGPSVPFYSASPTHNTKEYAHINIP